MRTLVLIACSIALPALRGAEDELTAAREFTAQLTMDQRADESIFTAAGRDRAQRLLSVTMEKGQRPDATAADRMGLHRAISGLIELHIWTADYYKASFYANVQQLFYGMLEHDYAEGLKFAQQAYDLQEKSGQKFSQFLNLKAIGENLLNLARPREAIDYFHRAQECMDERFSTTATFTWRLILQAEVAMHDFAAAEADLRRFQNEARSGPALFLAHSILGEAEIRMEQGRFPAALDALKRAQLSIANDPKAETFSVEIAKDLMSCLLDAMRMLPYDESLALARRVKSEFPGLPISLAPFAEQAIRVRRRMAGDIDGILREDSARLRDARSAGNVALQIEALRSLADTYRACNARNQEIAAIEEALQLEAALPQTKVSTPAERRVATWEHLRTLDQLAAAYLGTGDLSRARLRLDEMLMVVSTTAEMDSRRRIDSYYGSAMLGKAQVAEMDEDPDEARSILEKALSDPRFDRAQTLAQFARLERDAGEKPARAVDLYLQSLAILEKGRDRTSEFVTRFELAHYLATRAAKLPNASEQATRELDLVERGVRTANSSGYLWRVAYLRGILSQTAGRGEAALASYRSAIKLLDEMRGNVSGEEQRQAFMDNVTAEDLYRRLVAGLIAGGRNEEAWSYAERSKARVFLEMLQGRRFRDSGPETAELRAIEEKLSALESQLTGSNAVLLRSSGKIPAVLEAEKRGLLNRFALLRAESSLATSRHGSMLSTRPVEMAKLRLTLPVNAAVLEYYFLEKSLCTFVVSRDIQKVQCRDVDVPRLRQNVLRARRMLASSKPDDGMASLLEELSAALVHPQLAALPAGTRDLMVIPAGFLNYLPFQVLPLASGEPLIERYAVSYLPSASTLRSLGGGRDKSGGLSLLALGDVSVDGWEPLPGTLREIDDIAKVSPGAERVAQQAFTHDALQRALKSHDRVHIATHGLLNEQSPLFSALLTSPAAGQPSRLSLYELLSLNMKARLVVLSACETGLGRLLAGDEVVGLTRTFLQAGADTVVSSLWKVSDDSTALLMAEFHRLMGSGESPAEALRHAALKIRKQFPHPFYWAPFILTGVR